MWGGNKNLNAPVISTPLGLSCTQCVVLLLPSQDNQGSNFMQQLDELELGWWQPLALETAVMFLEIQCCNRKTPEHCHLPSQIYIDPETGELICLKPLPELHSGKRTINGHCQMYCLWLKVLQPFCDLQKQWHWFPKSQFSAKCVPVLFCCFWEHDTREDLVSVVGWGLLLTLPHTLFLHPPPEEKYAQVF